MPAVSECCLILTWQIHSDIVFLRKRDMAIGILTNEDSSGKMTLNFNGTIESWTRSDVISKHLLPFNTKDSKGDLKYKPVTVTNTQGGTRVAEIKQIDPTNALGFAFVVEYIDGDQATETVPISHIKYRSTHGNKKQKVAEATITLGTTISPTLPNVTTVITEFASLMG